MSSMDCDSHGMVCQAICFQPFKTFVYLISSNYAVYGF